MISEKPNGKFMFALMPVLATSDALAPVISPEPEMLPAELRLTLPPLS